MNCIGIVRKLILGLHLVVTISCSSAPQNESPAKETSYKITLDDPTNPKKIRFDVDSTPYTSNQDPSLTMNERIRLGMRRYAGEKLKMHKYCPSGFKGPDIVLGRKMSGESFFFVECLPPP